jgi:hypothetical protein
MCSSLTAIRDSREANLANRLRWIVTRTDSMRRRYAFVASFKPYVISRSNDMTDSEHWRSIYLRACERCRTLLLLRAATEIQETVGSHFVVETLQDLNAQQFLAEAAEKTVAQLFAQQFGRCPDGTRLTPLH